MSSGTGIGMVADEANKLGKASWRDLQGENSWKDLLDPLDIDLRKSLISYGELAQATGDAFNAEEHSPYLGACLYRRSHLLSGTGVAAAGHYRVTKLLYATSPKQSPNSSFLVRPRAAAPEWDGESNFMGYVAVATDAGVAALGRRDIVVAWRGTMRPSEVDKDKQFSQESAALVLGPTAGNAHPNAKVHRGFLSLYTTSNSNSQHNKTSARDQVLKEVKELVEQYKDEDISITVTGHSLGAALSILSAVDIAAHSVNVPTDSSRPPCPVTAFVFSCPQVGNPEFKAAFDSFPGLKALHVKNQGDIVPLLLLWVSERLGIKYVDVGVTLDIHTDKSPDLRKIPEISTLENCVTLFDLGNYLTRNAERFGIFHNLECYLHGVAGEQGGDAPFKLEVDRAVPLVNKASNALTDEHHVPANWWVAQNKHMVKDADGQWELKDYDL